VVLGGGQAVARPLGHPGAQGDSEANAQPNRHFNGLGLPHSGTAYTGDDLIAAVSANAISDSRSA
jgi:hypothetical protein